MLSKLIKNKIIITPEWNSKKEMYIQVNRAGLIIKGNKTFKRQKDMQDAWKVAIEYEYNRIMKKDF
jgi:hypothetical protein